MGFDQCFVLARWDRPLADLAANERIEGGPDPDEDLCWARGDGWRCFAPVGYYDGQLVPPVDEIAAQTGGPVLVAGVERSDHYILSFIEGGKVRVIDSGPYNDVTRQQHAAQMARQWGDPWPVEAAASLRRWARPLGGASFVGLFGAINVIHLLAEQTVFDLFRLVGLVPDPAERPWWEQIPEAVYGMAADDVGLMYRAGELVPPDTGLVLGFTEEGAGVWASGDERWLHEPSRDVPGVLDVLRERITSAGR